MAASGITISSLKIMPLPEEGAEELILLNRALVIHKLCTIFFTY